MSSNPGLTSLYAIFTACMCVPCLITILQEMTAFHPEDWVSIMGIFYMLQMHPMTSGGKQGTHICQSVFLCLAQLILI